MTDHPHSDPGDGRTECNTCGKWVWPFLHSCKGVPVTGAALATAKVTVPLAEVDGHVYGLTNRGVYHLGHIADERQGDDDDD